MRAGWLVAVAGVIALAAGCLHVGGELCEDGRRCPGGEVCDDAHDLCVDPEQIAGCASQPDGTACAYPGVTDGACVGGVCFGDLCGNGALDPGEVCDGTLGLDAGSAGTAETCSPDCKAILVCGNGVVDPGEACDDGNADPSDGCDACRLTAWTATLVTGAATPATSQALLHPFGVAADLAGRVYVADSDARRVFRIGSDGSSVLFAGNGTFGSTGATGGQATATGLVFPVGLAVDGVGRVYVVDATGARIERVDLDGTIHTIGGTGASGFSGDGGQAALAAVSQPSGIAVDGLGRVVFADTGNSRIRRIDVDGTIDTIAGIGVAAFDGDGTATAHAVSTPAGVAIDGQGRVIVADTSNCAVRVVDPDADTIVTVAGVAGDCDASDPDGSDATATHLAAIASVAIDAAGEIVFAESDVTRSVSRIRKVAGGNVVTVAGTGDVGFGGDGGPATSAQLDLPAGIVFDDSGRLVISDSGNQRVRRVDASGTITTIAGTGSQLSQQLTLGTTVGLPVIGQVAYDAAGRAYFASGQQVWRLDPDNTLTVIAGNGSFSGGSDDGDGGPAIAAELEDPSGVAVDAAGNVYVSDSEAAVVREIDASGIITRFAGTGTQGFRGDGSAATAAELSDPQGLAIDGQGRLLIADVFNARIRRVELDGTIDTIAGTGTFGDTGDGSDARQAAIFMTGAIAVDAQGRIVFPDVEDGVVRRIAADGTITTIADSLLDPEAVTCEGSDVLYGDGMTVKRLAGDGTTSLVAGTGSGDGVDGTGDGGPAPAAEVAFPQGLAVAPDGSIALAELNALRTIAPASPHVIRTVVGPVDPIGIGPIATARLSDPRALVVTADASVVAAGTSGTVEQVTATRVDAVAGRYGQPVPTGALARFQGSGFGDLDGLAFDASTRTLYVTEATTNRIDAIAEVDPSDSTTWTIATLAGDGSGGAAGFADGTGSAARLRAPTGLYLDAAGARLFVADTGNHAIRVVDLATGALTTFADVAGSFGFAGDGGPATAALLFSPSAVVACGGSLYIADTGNNRIRRVDALDGTGTITTVLGDGVATSSGEGTPASSFSVDAPRGLACDAFGNLFVSSTSVLRVLPPDAAGVVDGSGPVSSIAVGGSSCLTGVAAVGSDALEVTDSCAGTLWRLDRTEAP